MPGMGALGVHYVKAHRCSVVLQSTWDSTHNSPPTLFGQNFQRTGADNRYGLPAFYSLHAWIWKDNPSGTFSLWNPRVHSDAHTHAEDPDVRRSITSSNVIGHRLP